MPRPRKPTNVLAFTGAFRKDPQRARARSKEPRDLGELVKPAGLTEDESAAWDAIVSTCPTGVLKDRDAEIVRLAAVVRCELKRAPKAALIAQYRLLLSDLGMTPVAASKVAGTGEDKSDSSMAAI
jgi:hypothetical protein